MHMINRTIDFKRKLNKKFHKKYILSTQTGENKILLFQKIKFERPLFRVRVRKTFRMSSQNHTKIKQNKISLHKHNTEKIKCQQRTHIFFLLSICDLQHPNNSTKENTEFKESKIYCVKHINLNFKKSGKGIRRKKERIKTFQFLRHRDSRLDFEFIFLLPKGIFYYILNPELGLAVIIFCCFVFKIIAETVELLCYVSAGIKMSENTKKPE